KVADCSGLFSWAFKLLGGYMYHGSDTMFRKYCTSKGELKKGKRTDGATLKPGTSVFVWNGKKYSHVGLFIGGDTVIEAMGTINGVTTSKVTAGKWTHWGELTGVLYENAESAVSENSDFVQVQPVGKPTVRKGSKGDAVRELQIMLLKLGYDLGPCGIDGDFGKATEAAVRSFQSDHRLAVDGVVGKNTWAELGEALMTASGGNLIRAEVNRNEQSPQCGAATIEVADKSVNAISVKPVVASYRVIISGLDLTQARALLNNYPGSVIEEVKK
ncbi:MAG: peptidoglycan-binding protein, partial [Clostridia bacterium]|nr:peptidoglycan-binding protein [Clostridia bacterium]